MRLFRFIAAPLLAATLLAGPGQAQPAHETIAEDMRCLAVSLALTGDQAATERQRNAATMSSIYFLGRVNARRPNLDLTAALASEVRRITQADIAAGRDRCGQIMATRGDELSAAASHLDPHSSRSGASDGT